MSNRRGRPAALVFGLLAGCSVLEGGKLVTPESFGLSPLSPDIYVEAGADEATRVRLREAMEKAARAIRATYGTVNSRPRVHACVTERCYQAFGGRASVPRPSRDELMKLESLRQWLAAVERYGEPRNPERVDKGEPEIAPVYTAAGHEVRPWLKAAGSRGLDRFIERMNAGEDFLAAYRTVPRPDIAD